MPKYMLPFRCCTRAGPIDPLQYNRRLVHVLHINPAIVFTQKRGLSLSRPTSLPRPSISTHSLPEIRFSAGQPDDLPKRLLQLSATWDVAPSKSAITRQFTFRTFSDAWRFMNLVAEECKAKRHHPSWSNLYNKVTIEWTTHEPQGLSIKDVEMAAFCDRAADEIGLKSKQ